MAFFISPRLASIYLVAIIILGIILAIITVRAHHYFMEVFPKYDDLNASVQENVSAIRVVKAYVREDYEKNKFRKASQNIYNMFVKAESILAFNNPVMQITVYSCILAISWVGAKMIVGGTLTTGELMSLLTYCMNIMMSLMMLSMVFVMLAMSVASAERICEVLNEKSDITNPENADKTVPDGSITFDHVTFRYSKTSAKPVLSDIDLSIKSGETIGIIGGTGSSKSSLVNLISRLYDVSEGRVLVGGKDVRSYDLDTLRNEVSVVLQNNVLFSGTIYENLRWGDAHAVSYTHLDVYKRQLLHQLPDLPRPAILCTVDHPLVGRPFKQQGYIMKLRHKRSVHQHIDRVKQLRGICGAAFSARHKIPV